MNRVLILGAGMVAKPMVEYLLEKRYRLVIASPMKERADGMINGNPLGHSVDWSMDDRDTLDWLISENDITVSLLPFRYHPEVAKICLKNRRPLVTTSYVQPEMAALNRDAGETGILFLNEMGLDPGIDHMSAMRLIDHIHGLGGKVHSFYSLCGALPSPEAADNPLRYKFTWSPKGVILASRNSALYMTDGKKVHVAPEDLFKNRFLCHFPGIGDLEVYPNRDSVSYAAIYNIPEAGTMYRGTFRFKGWCETLDAMKSIGMLDDTPENYSGKSYSDFMAVRTGTNTENIRQKCIDLLRLDEGSAAIESLDWLGFFSDEKLDYKETTPFEITSDRMISRMMLSDNDRDMVVMLHVILAEYPGGRKEVVRSSLLDFGSPSDNTAIARTVALPAAIAVRLILEKKIDLSGVHRPVRREIYNPVLDELKTLKIEMKEEYGLPESEMITGR